MPPDKRLDWRDPNMPVLQWTIAVFMTMIGYCPVIFSGYTVKYVGKVTGTLKADNDNVLRFK